MEKDGWLRQVDGRMDGQADRQTDNAQRRIAETSPQYLSENWKYELVSRRISHSHKGARGEKKEKPAFTGNKKTAESYLRKATSFSFLHLQRVWSCAPLHRPV